MSIPRDFIAVACETTGLDICSSRLVEIGCVEVLDGKITGKHLHTILNPGLSLGADVSTSVHGLSSSTLSKADSFKKKASKFVDFIAGHTVVLFNSSIDHTFLDAELARAGQPPLCLVARSVIDGQLLAKSVGIQTLAGTAARESVHGEDSFALEVAETIANKLTAGIKNQPSASIGADIPGNGIR
ncbi:exonuclease domain-containing protein [Alcanivorax sp. 1008]|uniref:3'-5' exonuclease n=1 Tax=Alcanivorax sp. 1008 TaxID=2816853 RepID=UPI001DCA63E5|nr:exonuclease domain-containing protein [Alcanivorax sp. 1008]MCC1496791.1 hypothetical protein [Alcanivorax sp. 1008]